MAYNGQTCLTGRRSNEAMKAQDSTHNLGALKSALFAMETRDDTNCCFLHCLKEKCRDNMITAPLFEVVELRLSK